MESDTFSCVCERMNNVEMRRSNNGTEARDEHAKQQQQEGMRGGRLGCCMMSVDDALGR